MKSTSLLSFLLLSISFVHTAPVPAAKRACSATNGACHISRAIRVDSGALIKRQFDDFGGDSGDFGEDFGGDTGGDSGDDFGGDTGGDFSSSDLGGDTGDDFGDDAEGDPTFDDTFEGDGGFDDSSSGDFDDSALDTTDPDFDDSTSTDPSLDTFDPNADDTFGDTSGLDGGTTDDVEGLDETTDDSTEDTTEDDSTGDDGSIDDTDSTDNTTADDDSNDDTTAANPSSADDTANSKAASPTKAAPPAKAPPAQAAPPAKAPPAKAAPPTGAAGATCPPAINDATVNLIKDFEGFVASPAPDPIGLPTVGFGHKCEKAGCSEVPFSFPLSQATAAQLLQNDVKTFTKCVNDFVSPNVKLNDNQFGALTSFAFNLGCGNLKSSTLLKRLNAGEDPNTVAAQEIPKFNKAGGKVLAGLTRRRNAEVGLFKTASSTVAHPCN